MKQLSFKPKITCVQSNLSKGRITDLSPLANANGFVRSNLHQQTFSLYTRESALKTASPSVHLFLHNSPVCLNRRPVTPRGCKWILSTLILFNTWFLEVDTRVSPLNGIWIGSPRGGSRNFHMGRPVKGPSKFWVGKQEWCTWGRISFG